MNTRNAFTIVELAVVIAIIGILSTITFVGYQKLQVDTRDTERETDIAVVQSALETYYEKEGRYPSWREFYGSGGYFPNFKQQTLNIPKSAVKAPGSTAEDSFSDLGSLSPSSVPTNVYHYAPTVAATDVCWEPPTGGSYNVSYVCLKYELRYTKENGGLQTIQSKYGW